MKNNCYYIFILLVLLISTIECYSIGKSQCQRNCNSSYDACYKDPNANYTQCNSSHRECMSRCDVIGCKEDCDNMDRNCSINRRGNGCAGFNILSCNLLCNSFNKPK